MILLFFVRSVGESESDRESEKRDEFISKPWLVGNGVIVWLIHNGTQSFYFLPDPLISLLLLFTVYRINFPGSPLSSRPSLSLSRHLHA